MLAGGLVLGLITLALGAGTASAAGVSLPAAGGGTTRLVPGYLRGLSLANQLGAAPAGQQLTIGVELTRPNPPASRAVQRDVRQGERPVPPLPHPGAVQQPGSASAPLSAPPSAAG